MDGGFVVLLGLGSIVPDLCGERYVREDCVCDS